MKIKQSKDVTNFVVGGEVSNKKSFQIQTSEKMFGILSSQIYADKVCSPVREILCNAVDANKTVSSDLPVYISLPQQSNSHNNSWVSDSDVDTQLNLLEISDSGPGLSEKELEEVYTIYGVSTKSGSDAYTGCLGLGSKSPFAYVSLFSVESRHGGFKRSYVCRLEKGVPYLEKVNECEMEDTEHTGVTVSYAIKSDDVNKVRCYVKNLTRVVDVPVYLKDAGEESWEQVEKAIPYASDGIFEFYDKAASLVGDYATSFSVTLLMGGVVYPTPCTYLSAWASKLHERLGNYYISLERVFRNISSHNIMIKLPIGSLDILVSREGIELTDENKDIFNKALDAAVKPALEELDNVVDDETLTTLDKVRELSINKRWEFSFVAHYLKHKGYNVALEYDIEDSGIYREFLDFQNNPEHTNWFCYNFDFGTKVEQSKPMIRSQKAYNMGYDGEGGNYYLTNDAEVDVTGFYTRYIESRFLVVYYDRPHTNSKRFLDHLYYTSRYNTGSYFGITELNRCKSKEVLITNSKVLYNMFTLWGLTSDKEEIFIETLDRLEQEHQDTKKEDALQRKEEAALRRQKLKEEREALKAAGLLEGDVALKSSEIRVVNFHCTQVLNDCLDSKTSLKCGERHKDLWTKPIFGEVDSEGGHTDIIVYIPIEVKKGVNEIQKKSYYHAYSTLDKSNLLSKLIPEYFKKERVPYLNLLKYVKNTLGYEKCPYLAVYGVPASDLKYWESVPNAIPVTKLLSKVAITKKEIAYIYFKSFEDYLRSNRDWTFYDCLGQPFYIDKSYKYYKTIKSFLQGYDSYKKGQKNCAITEMQALYTQQLLLSFEQQSMEYVRDPKPLLARFYSSLEVTSDVLLSFNEYLDKTYPILRKIDHLGDNNVRMYVEGVNASIKKNLNKNKSEEA